HRAERPAELPEAGREVRDLDGSARCVEETGDEDRRVRQVLLLRAHAAVELDREPPGAAEQRAERRVAIEAREAGPHDLGRRIHERGDRAVADEREVQRRHRRALPSDSSHARAAATSRRRHVAAVRPGPTLMEWPASRFTVAKPYSSVRSSPTNTGVRPRNGASRMNAATAAPLSRPAGFTSTTRLPAWMPNLAPSRGLSERTSR